MFLERVLPFWILWTQKIQVFLLWSSLVDIEVTHGIPATRSVLRSTQPREETGTRLCSWRECQSRSLKIRDLVDMWSPNPCHARGCVYPGLTLAFDVKQQYTFKVCVQVIKALLHRGTSCVAKFVFALAANLFVLSETIVDFIVFLQGTLAQGKHSLGQAFSPGKSQQTCKGYREKLTYP